MLLYGIRRCANKKNGDDILVYFRLTESGEKIPNRFKNILIG